MNWFSVSLPFQLREQTLEGSSEEDQDLLNLKTINQLTLKDISQLTVPDDFSTSLLSEVHILLI